MNNAYRAIMRKKLLERIYDKMTPEEKNLFIRMSLENKDHREIMAALAQQRSQLNNVAQKIEKQSWLTDFGSDVAANFLTDGIIYLARRLFKH